MVENAGSWNKQTKTNTNACKSLYLIKGGIQYRMPSPKVNIFTDAPELGSGPELMKNVRPEPELFASHV